MSLRFKVSKRVYTIVELHDVDGETEGALIQLASQHAEHVAMGDWAEDDPVQEEVWPVEDDDAEYVWIVQQGELGQGGSCYGVYKERETAMARALELQSMNHSDWQPDPSTYECASWGCGGDWMQVSRTRLR